LAVEVDAGKRTYARAFQNDRTRDANMLAIGGDVALHLHDVVTDRLVLA